MKFGFSRISRAVLASLLALTMLFSMAVPAFAAIDIDHNNDNKINYVSIGASNVNGFGLTGYYSDKTYGDPVNKEVGSVYGYQMTPEAAYPTILKNALENLTGKTVVLNQLAISSMRAEELHVLLDNDYYGDSYTEDIFTGGSNYFAAAHPDGLDGLRADYQNYISNADIITVDIGANNFAIYTSSRLLGGSYDADFSQFTTTTQETLAWIRPMVASIVIDTLGNDELTEPVEYIVDTFTYAIIGFCSNFDASMERIYELNPDATVVVVNIQNVLNGLEATLPGQDSPIAFGDLYGMIVNIANLYTAAISPYAGRYNYAYLGDDGEANTFLADIQAYTGNPEDLSVNLKDSFDIYDNDMFLKTRVLQAYALMAMSASKVSIANGYTKYTLNDVSDISKFSTIVSDNALVIAGVDVQSFLKNGEKGTLAAEAQSIYKQFNATLLNAYDAIATLMQLGANTHVIDFSDIAALEQYETILADVYSIIGESIQNPDFVIENSESFKSIKNNPTALTILSLGVRSALANSFYSHPNEDGHQEVADCIIKALKKKATSNFAKDKDSYYIALGDGVAAERKSYVQKLGKALDIDYKNLAKEGQTAADARGVIVKNSSLFAKADLVTVDYSDAAITEFMFAQMDAAISGKRPAELDWNALLGDADALVDTVLENVRAMLVEQNLDVDFMGLNLADLLLSGIEGYAYAYATRLICYADAIDAIKEYAPDALIVLVGTYNDFNDITFTMEGMELDISSYVEYVVMTLNYEGRLYAAIEPGRVIYVEAPEVETIFAADIAAGEYENINLMTYLTAVKKGELRPTADGYTYIADQLLAGIPLHTHTYASDCATECATCGGAKRASATPHTYEHDCSKICKLCSEVRTGVSHEFGEWTVEAPATESSTGLEVRACKHCAATESREIPMLPPAVTTPTDTTPSDTPNDTPNDSEPADTPDETDPIVTPELTTPTENEAGGCAGCGGFSAAMQLIAIVTAAGAFVLVKKNK